jgi:putative transposase
MREANLRALHGYRTRRWAVGKPSVLIPNLVQRQLTTTRPNKAWVTDITYIRTWQGWLSLAVVMDLFSRMIVGWAAGPSPRARAQCCPDRGAAPTATWHVDSLRPGHSIRQRRVAPLLSFESPRAEHESKGQLLGQRCRRVLLQQLEERADQKTHLQEPRSPTSPTTSMPSIIARRHGHLGGLSPEQFEAAHKPPRSALH